MSSAQLGEAQQAFVYSFCLQFCLIFFFFYCGLFAFKKVSVCVFFHVINYLFRVLSGAV